MDVKGQKHAVKCRCILPQYKKRKDPVFHEFVVFSEIIDGSFLESFAQCNNCGVVHKVIDLCKSKILSGNEGIRSLQNIDDICIGLPEDIVLLLKGSNADLATFQEIDFIIRNKIYGKKALLEKEIVDEYVVGKFISLLENGRFRVEPFSYQAELKK